MFEDSSNILNKYKWVWQVIYSEVKFITSG